MFNGPNVNIKKQSSTQRREVNKKLKNGVITKAWTPKEGIHTTSEKAEGERREGGRREREGGDDNMVFSEKAVLALFCLYLFFDFDAEGKRANAHSRSAVHTSSELEARPELK